MFLSLPTHTWIYIAAAATVFNLAAMQWIIQVPKYRWPQVLQPILGILFIGRLLGRGETLAEALYDYAAFLVGFPLALAPFRGRLTREYYRRLKDPTAKPNMGLGAAAATLLIIMVIGPIVAPFFLNGATGVNKTGGNIATPPPAAVDSPSVAPSSPRPKHKRRTVLVESGGGFKTTKTFRVHDDWDLHYSYNCANFALGEGNFQIWKDGLTAVYVNELGKRGSDVTHQHDGSGSMALKIDSGCDWKIKVVQLP